MSYLPQIDEFACPQAHDNVIEWVGGLYNCFISRNIVISQLLVDWETVTSARMTTEDTWMGKQVSKIAEDCLIIFFNNQRIIWVKRDPFVWFFCTLLLICNLSFLKGTFSKSTLWNVIKSLVSIADNLQKNYVITSTYLVKKSLQRIRK